MKKRYIIAIGLLIFGIILILGPLIIHKMHNEKISKEICISEINGDPVKSFCPKEPISSSETTFIVLGVFSLISILLVCLKNNETKVKLAALMVFCLFVALGVIWPSKINIFMITMAILLALVNIVFMINDINKKPKSNKKT